MQILSILYLALTIVTVKSALTVNDVINLRMSWRRCRESTNLDSLVITRGMEGKLGYNPQFDCFIACILEETGIASPDGSLNPEVAISKLPETRDRDAIANIILSCANQAEGSEDQCENARTFFECVQQPNFQIPALFLIADLPEK